jgi:hypothetical protein
MTSACERHGLKHLSASTLNLFQNAPGLFIIEKLMGRRQPVGCAAHRGNAAEKGIIHGLNDLKAPVEDCQKIAIEEFDRLTALSGDPKREHERKVVPLIVAQGLTELRPYGTPSHYQQEVLWEHPELPLPMRGFIDLRWEDQGILTDIKTTLRVPSEISESHARQVSSYGHAISDNTDLRLTYISDKKAVTYQLENAKQHLAAMIKIAHALEKFLSISDDPKELAKYIAVDFGSFYWNDPGARQAGFEVFGY